MFFVPNKIRGYKKIKSDSFVSKFIKDQIFDICMMAADDDNAFSEIRKHIPKNYILESIIDKEIKEYYNEYLESGTRFIKTKKAN